MKEERFIIKNPNNSDKLQNLFSPGRKVCLIIRTSRNSHIVGIRIQCFEFDCHNKDNSLDQFVAPHLIEVDVPLKESSTGSLHSSVPFGHHLPY
jgi:hypothetical protein